MAIIGDPQNYSKKFKYGVEIDGFVRARFKTCSALEAEAAVVEQWEGGDITPDKSLGRVTVSDLTLERGECGDLDAWNWFKTAVNMAAGKGAATPAVRRNVAIVQYELDDTERKRWNVFEALPRKFIAGDWADADENVIETLVLAFRYFDLVV